jgi:erythromycin esterase-like protein
LAGHITAWGLLSVNKTGQAIDAIVDQVDPAALRRSREASSMRTPTQRRPGRRTQQTPPF